VRAARIHAHGGPDVLTVEEVAEPSPGPGELLVRQRASSVNHRDAWIRRGHPHPAYHVDLPAVLGIDVCGDVVEVGPGVEGFREGDRVTANPYMECGTCRECHRGRAQYCTRFSVYNGAHAELVAVPARWAIPVDPSVPVEAVACFPNAYITAWEMLVHKAGITPDDTVFVWAGTSGLGNAGIDIARLVGTEVIATARADKQEALRSLGPDLALDHHADDVVARTLEHTGGEGATIVFEHIGQATWERSLALLASGGTIVTAGATSGDEGRFDVTYQFVKQARILGSRLGDMDDALAAARQLSLGRFRPLVGARLGLDEIGEAHRLLETGDVAGKVVVTFD
jgi:NADPH:quinone reductase-like Zn-dependent oxidoreductase